MVKQILCLFDYGTGVNTGFATVSRNLVKQLKDHFGDDLLLHICAVNYQGASYTEYNGTVKIESGKICGQQYQQSNNIKSINYETGHNFGIPYFLHLISSNNFDGIFHIGNLGACSYALPLLQMAWQMKKDQGKKTFKSVIYFPVEGALHQRVKNLEYDPQNKNLCPKQYRHFFEGKQYITQADTLDFFEASITFTQFGYNELIRIKPSLAGYVDIIPHGINTADFYPLPEADIRKFRKKYFGNNAGKYIIGVINKNQQRKDIPTAIFAFIQAKKDWPEHLPPPFLYLHCNPMQPMGHRLDSLLSLTGLVEGKDYMFPKTDDANCHVDIPTLNNIYNAIDVYLSTARGGGWELTVTEAMACKTPCIIPKHSSMAELGTGNRAFFVDEFLQVSDTHDSLIGYMSHPDAVAEMIIRVAELTCLEDDFRIDLISTIENAYKWVTEELPWEGKIKEQFIDIFDEIYFDGKYEKN